MLVRELLYPALNRDREEEWAVLHEAIPRPAQFLHVLRSFLFSEAAPPALSSLVLVVIWITEEKSHKLMIVGDETTNNKHPPPHDGTCAAAGRQDQLGLLRSVRVHFAFDALDQYQCVLIRTPMRCSILTNILSPRSLGADLARCFFFSDKAVRAVQTGSSGGKKLGACACSVQR